MKQFLDVSDKILIRWLEMYKDLDQPTRLRIEHVLQFGFGVCSKCRWQSGCFECDPVMALRYHLSKTGWIPKEPRQRVKVAIEDDQKLYGQQRGGGEDF